MGEGMIVSLLQKHWSFAPRRLWPDANRRESWQSNLRWFAVPNLPAILS